MAAMVALAASSVALAEETLDQAAQQARAQAMEQMIAEIQDDTARTADLTGIARIDPRVIDALRRTPRERFVPPRNRSLAYANHPLPIGHGQTISQPFIVAIMTHALRLEPGHRALEIGTGSGYQAAVLAALAEHVYSIEIVTALAETARQRLADLGYRNVSVLAGDGWNGWPENAPFDAVIVTAVGPEIPPALLDQLAPNGRLVMPVGDADGFQELIVYDNGTGETTTLFPVRFVPLTGGPAG